MATIQEFSALRTNIERYKEDFQLKSVDMAFSFFAIDHIFNLKLQDDDIEESITDNGNDGGVDAIYIEEDSDKEVIINFFQFKHTQKYEKIKNHLSGNAVDKLITFFDSLSTKDRSFLKELNPKIADKVKYIWSLYEKGSPKLRLHVCSNYANNFQSLDQAKLDRKLTPYSIEIKYWNILNFSTLLLEVKKTKIDAKIKANGREYLEGSAGGTKYLIANVELFDLVRIVSNKSDFRDNPIYRDISAITAQGLSDSAFDANVRVYLQSKTRINTGIRDTLLSAQRERFFYYNNGVTLICKDFTFLKVSGPVINISDLQIVNGSQTIHAAFDALRKDKEALADACVLLRIYATGDSELSGKIAEYTNSQNPVRGRDIRANDHVQKVLENELLQNGYFYERKKNFYKDKPKTERIDSEKVGQVVMSYYLGLPGEAKNEKKTIFDERYEKIFDENLITASYILLPYKLFQRIEAYRRKEWETDKCKKESFLPFASYALVYSLRLLADKNNLKTESKIWGMFVLGKGIISAIVKEQQAKLGEGYSHQDFFKSALLKDAIKEAVSKLKVKAK